MSIGDRIKQRRIDLELTADDLAYRVGKSRATIYRYENGDIENMPTTVLEPLADALHTTPAYLMGWTNDPHNREQIGNDQGMYPSKDYEGSYEDYVKYKVMQESDDLCDSYWNLYDDAIKYLKSLGCQIIEDTTTNNIQVITPINEKLEVPVSDLVSNFMIFGASKPGIKKLLLQKTAFDNMREDERQLLTNYNLLNFNGKIEARKRIAELSMIPVYTISEPMLNAAHARTDIEPTDEDQAHDDAIMNDDSEWE